MIKGKKSLSSQLMESNNLQDLHNSILQKIMQLDRLNNEYKNKQEEHFIKMFMNVLEKMGNDLILAQQAYRNIDIEVKRDKYIVQLAAQLSFFKEECFTLKREVKKMKAEVESTRLDNQTIKNQINSIRTAYEKKTKECDRLKDIGSQLKKEIKVLKNGENERIFKFTTTEKDIKHQQISSERDITTNIAVSKEQIKSRWLSTQQAKRRGQVGQSVDLGNPYSQQNRFILSPKKPNNTEIKFRTTNYSSQRRNSQSKSKQQQTDCVTKI